MQCHEKGPRRVRRGAGDRGPEAGQLEERSRERSEVVSKDEREPPIGTPTEGKRRRPEGRQLDFPLEDVLRQAEALSNAGADVYQKFTCSGCGSRQGIPEPNKFYASASCEECGTVTDLRKQGCNFTVVSG